MSEFIEAENPNPIHQESVAKALLRKENISYIEEFKNTEEVIVFCKGTRFLIKGSLEEVKEKIN